MQGNLYSTKVTSIGLQRELHLNERLNVDSSMVCRGIPETIRRLAPGAILYQIKGSQTIVVTLQYFRLG